MPADFRHLAGCRHRNVGEGMELNVLGLTDETEHVYKVLVGLPRATASEVAEACGRPASAVGKLLSGLVRDGLATRSAGRPPRFTAVSPDVAVTALIQEREHRLDEARSLVERLTQTHREAARISHPDMAVELLSDRDDISAAVRRLRRRRRGARSGRSTARRTWTAPAATSTPRSSANGPVWCTG